MSTSSVFKEDILKGKTVLVTGGGTGIGFGICRTLGLHGANVALASRKKDVIDKACVELGKLGIKTLGLELDVRSEEVCKNVVDSVVKKFGRIDFLVNNAAGNFMSSVENLTVNGFKTVLDIDTIGCFNMSKAALPHFKNQSFGVIINISATLHYRATPFQMHASAAKAAIDAFTNNVGVEWGEYGIRCVGVAPGPISDTAGGPTGRVFGGKSGMVPGPSMMPLGKFGTVDDISNLVCYLVSPAGEFITATTIVVDGGQWHGTADMFKRAKKFVMKKSDNEKKNFKGGVEKSNL